LRCLVETERWELVTSALVLEAADRDIFTDRRGERSLHLSPRANRVRL